MLRPAAEQEESDVQLNLHPPSQPFEHPPKQTSSHPLHSPLQDELHVLEQPTHLSEQLLPVHPGSNVKPA